MKADFTNYFSKV